MAKREDKKTFRKRTKSSNTGNSTGKKMTETSNILAIQHDIKQGAIVSEHRLKILREWEKKNKEE